MAADVLSKSAVAVVGSANSAGDSAAVNGDADDDLSCGCASCGICGGEASGDVASAVACFVQAAADESCARTTAGCWSVERVRDAMLASSDSSTLGPTPVAQAAEWEADMAS